MSKYKYRLMAPGPVMLAPEIKAILAQDMIHHRSPLLSEDLKTVFAHLPRIFDCDGKVACLTSTGSGAMQASVSNFIKKTDKVLVIVSGKFGERWQKMLEKKSSQVLVYNVEWGKTLDLNELESILKTNPDIKALYTQACETSTGHMHDIAKIAACTKKIVPNALVIVDAITTILTCPFSMKDMQIDVCVAGSQKAFMLPTGMSFIALAKSALERIVSTDDFYFDLNLELKAQEKLQTGFSSNVPLIRSLAWLVKKIDTEGKNSFISEVQRRALATRAALEVYKLKFVSDNPAYALSAVYVPENIDGKQLRLDIEENYNMTFMGGQDHLLGKIIRIGHLGHIEESDVLDSVEILGLALQDHAYDCDIERAKAAAKKVYDEHSNS